MGNMDFDIHGLDDLGKIIERLGPAAIKTAAKSLYESGEIVMTRSKDQYVPVDTGALRASGNVQLEVNGDQVTVQLGYGGPAADYAVHVHEINKHYNGGRVWKYLETPLKEAIPEIETKLATDLRSGLESA